MKNVKHPEAKGYEARRVPGRDSHSASEKQVKHQAEGAKSHSKPGKQDRK